MIALIGAAVVLAAAAVLWSRSAADPLEQQAEQFVELALSVGIAYPDEIDAWFGPAALDPREPGKTAVPPAEILAEARALLADTSALAAATPSARSARLQQRLEKFVVLLETLVTPKALTFADEAFKLYNITLPPLQSAESHQALLDAVEALLPGQGSLAFRVAALQNILVVPADKRITVFERALQECRSRTLAHWTLPAD